MQGTPQNQPLSGRPHDFDAFLARFDTPSFRGEIIAQTGTGAAAAGALLDTYFAEMRFGHRFLQERLPPGKLRILEIGAGLGLLSIWLHRQGHEVVALEPAAHGFGLFEVTRRTLWSQLAGPLPALIEAGAETLDPQIHGHFDFIFSINVMEHVALLDKSFAAAVSVLAPKGRWINSCPNYHVPYEPHYALPMVPFSPGLTRRLFSARLDGDPQIWESLNFISWSKVRKMARTNGVDVRFESGLLHQSLMRLTQDPAFLERHKNGLAVRVFDVLRALRLLALVKHLPPALSTPMVFAVTRKRVQA